MSDKKNIMLIIETGGPGGGEQVFLNLVKNIDREQFNLSAILFNEGWLYDQLTVHKIKTTIISSKRSWDLNLLYRLIRSCNRQNIDIIHSHYMGANLYAGLVGAILRIPVVATFHNELILAWWKYRYSRLKHFIIRNFTSKVVLVADFMKQDYMEIAGIPSSKLSIIYNGIKTSIEKNDFDSTSLRKGLGLSGDDLLIGHIANFRIPKGHRFLIEAAGLVCKKLKNVKFLLIGDEGDGSLKGEIQDLITKMGLTNNVRLLGFRDDIQQLLNLIDIFVLPSTSEGLPLSVIEAMAASKPVVATNVGGLAEIVIPDKTGYLVEAGNVHALAEKLLILLADEGRRGQMGEQGRKAVERKFSLDVMIDKYQKLYAELLK